MTEAELQQNIIELANLLGWRAAHFRPALCKVGGRMVYRTAVSGQGKGFPDLVLARSGRVLFIEVKSSKGRLSPEQQEWLDVLPNSYCWRPEDWERIVEILNTQKGDGYTQKGEVIYGTGS